MARPLVSQRPERLFANTRVPNTRDAIKQPTMLWSEPKGIDGLRPLNKLEPGYAAEMENFMFLDGQLHSRYGTRLLGNNAASEVMQAVDLIRANGKKVTIRFCLRHVEVFNYATSTWRSFAVALTGSEDDWFTWTSWADKLLFSNGVNGLWELDFTTYAITQVEGAPSARHLTVFGNRVIATAADGKPYRIQWSVKNNYLDWTGIGSGFEDMFGTPGGVVDEAMKTIPVTDEAAYVIRATSLWQMSESGVAIAPFRFSRLIRAGSPSRESIVETPRGVVFLNHKSVYLAAVGNFQDIGQRIIKRLKEAFGDIRGAYATYDPVRDEYRVCRCRDVFRFRWDETGWTKDIYAFQVRSLGSQIIGKTGFPIDSLVGIIDDLEGTIDDLTIGRPFDDKMLIVPDDSVVTLRESDDETPAQDQEADGTLVDAPLSITTGIFNLNILEATEILEAHLEYEAAEAQDLRFEYLSDSGGSFIFITEKALTVTTGHEIKRLQLAQFSRRLQFKISSETLGRLNLLSFSPSGVEVRRAS